MRDTILYNVKNVYNDQIIRRRLINVYYGVSKWLRMPNYFSTCMVSWMIL